MDKNTIWAIVLMTLVIIGFTVIQTKFFPARRDVPAQSAETSQNVAESAEGAEAAGESDEGGLLARASLSSAEDEAVPERTIEIATDKIKVTLTTRGGDVTGFELLDHIDTDTKAGVQLSDNITGANRAFALSLGGADAFPINDTFNVETGVDDEGGRWALFTKKYAGFTLGKKYTFKDGEYMFRLEALLHSEGSPVTLDKSGVAYTLRTPPQIGPRYDPKVNRYETREFIAFNGEKKKRINVGQGQFKSYDKPWMWAGIAGKYFEAIVVPQNKGIMSGAFYSSSVESDGRANAQARLERSAFTGTDMDDVYYIYCGPRNEKDLRKYNSAEANAWGREGLKLTESLQTSGWLGWLETILKWCLEMIHKVIPNWGVAIILLTVIFKLAMFPLTKNQSMSSLKMQELQPKMQALQERYKDDQQRLQIELSKLYKENDYNPMGGCLPMILQFLTIFAMYNLFNNYFEFRGAAFIPGWIPDLSASDSVLTFKKSVFFFGNRLSLLPFIYLATQLFYGKITQYGGAGGGGASGGQMKFMMYGMPVIFFFVFYNAPSGLLLYWTVSNVIQMAQQVAINRIMARKKAELARPANQGDGRKIPPRRRRRH